MRYLDKRFSVASPGTTEYAAAWERTFAKSAEALDSAEVGAHAHVHQHTSNGVGKGTPVCGEGGGGGGGLAMTPGEGEGCRRSPVEHDLQIMAGTNAYRCTRCDGQFTFAEVIKRLPIAPCLQERSR